MEDIQKLRFSLELEQKRKYLTGVQAMVFSTIVQAARDKARGLNTAGFVSGYRGSPLGGLDRAFQAAEKVGALKSANVLFHPGVNEDLAADSVWGTQQTGLLRGSRADGVFGMWYGKGPGLDRSADAIKHANYAGVAPKGGVIAMVGDDHACKSSTMPYQSEQACVHIGMPVLAPSSVQEIFDFALAGWAMSRFSGAWIALKAVTDLCEASSTVLVDDETPIVVPDMSSENPYIRINVKPLEIEHLKRLRLARAQRFADANMLNAVTHDTKDVKFGIIAVGYAYTQTMEALRMLGLTDRELQALGIVVIRVGMTWPFFLTKDMLRIADQAEFLLVVEERESFVEAQLKTALYGRTHLPRVIGKRNRDALVLPETGTLSAARIASAIAELYCSAWSNPALQSRAKELAERERNAYGPSQNGAERVPFYCSGCPHNTSTRIPQGSVALAGIGCHYMAQWMGDRPTILVTQMGGEGVPALGLLPFSETPHVFVNMGDGTYFHSGLMAIRAAVAWSVKFPDKGITYKVLYNDAVAMTGGQHVDGTLTVPQLTHQVHAEGVSKIAVVAEFPDAYSTWDCAPGTTIHPRGELDAVMDEFKNVKGISVLIYDQTCAAEKRRRRKRNELPCPPERVLINERVCEGCGDCSIASNCLSIEPVETPFGVKRKINQSSCNKDMSCANGFCPSFVLVDGAIPRARPARVSEYARAPLPEPMHRLIREPYNILLMGTGGTGVITVEQILATAAHRAGLSASGLSITGLSQKYGAVSSHVRIAPRGHETLSPRIPWGETDLLLGCDLVSSSGREGLSLLARERTTAVINSAAAPTAEFVLDRNATLPTSRMHELIAEKVGLDSIHCIEATSYATELFGDAIETNIFLVGYAFQRGFIPIPSEHLIEAIELNAASVATNKQAFACGRFAAAFPTSFALADWRFMADRKRAMQLSVNERYVRFAEELEAYQDKAYADRYRRVVEKMAAFERKQLSHRSSAIMEAVADNYFKVLAYKDEYEVARLYTNGEFREQVARAFGKSGKRKSLMLAPPLFARKDPRTGLPKKGKYGPWIWTAMHLLAKGKFLRGTWCDPFRFTRDRRDERELICWYEGLMIEVRIHLAPHNKKLTAELLSLPRDIRGYGHVKRASIEKARKRAEEIVAQLRDNSRAQT